MATTHSASTATLEKDGTESFPATDRCPDAKLSDDTAELWHCSEQSPSPVQLLVAVEHDGCESEGAIKLLINFLKGFQTACLTMDLRVDMTCCGLFETSKIVGTAFQISWPRPMNCELSKCFAHSLKFLFNSATPLLSKSAHRILIFHFLHLFQSKQI